MNSSIHTFLSNETFALKPTGNSMNPLFNSGDILVYKRINFKSVKVDDIILIKKNGRYITHRVVYRNSRFLVTKGDGNVNNDGKVFPTQVIAQAIKIKRNNKQFMIENIYLIQSSHYLKEIWEIVTEFKKHDLNYVILKGLPLHLYYEKAHPRRVYADCDVLINPMEREKATHILRKLGYERVLEKETSFASFKEAPPIEEDYYKYSNGFPIFLDVHFDISMSTLHSPSLRKNLNELTTSFLENKRKVKIKGEMVPMLKEEDLLLYLLLHQVNHSWGGFSQYQFIHLLINALSSKKRTSWETVLTKAKKFKILNFIIPSLYFLKIYYGDNLLLRICKKKYKKETQHSLFMQRLLSDNSSFFYKVVGIFPIQNKYKFFVRFLLYDYPFIFKVGELMRLDILIYVIWRFFKQQKNKLLLRRIS